MNLHPQDHRVFLQHYDETKDKLFTFLMYRVNYNQVEAEDVLMDVVVRAYENFHTFDPQKGSFQKWIYSIAWNYLKNLWRSQKGKETASLDQLQETGFMPSVESSENALDSQLTGEAVQKVLGLLPTEERQIIVLRYIQDLSYDEIADITGKKEGALRTQLSRALERFTDYYQKFYSHS